MVDSQIDEWYAASLVFAVLVENKTGGRGIVQVHLLAAQSFEEAFGAALRLGSETEETYVNADGERVRWGFVRVETLDLLPTPITDGLEVYSAPYPLTEFKAARFEDVFAPGSHAPGQSGVSPT